MRNHRFLLSIVYKIEELSVGRIKMQFCAKGKWRKSTIFTAAVFSLGLDVSSLSLLESILLSLVEEIRL